MTGVLLVGFWALWAWASTQLAGPGSGPAELLASAALAAAGLVAVVLAVHLATGRLILAVGSALHLGTGLRARALGARMPRLRDPNAAGRARPRAPAILPSIAA